MGSGHEVSTVGIIGAGPAGLSAGAALSARGIPFEILDAGDRIGGIWDIERAETPMYESAHFISSKTMSGFPGFPMPREYPDYPRHDQILTYVQAFAAARGIEPHVRLGSRVESAAPEGEGGLANPAWRLTLGSGEERVYSALVVASGMAWYPNLPEIPGSFEGELFHSFHYRSPERLRGRRVLVVGGGNSGCDIACDAARVAERAFLSLRRGYHFVPKYVFGKPADVFAHQGPSLPRWLEERLFGFLLSRVLVGDLTRYGLPRPDHRILESHPIMNTQVLHHLGHGDLEVKPDVASWRGGRVLFADGTEEEVDVVILATGYRRVFPFFGDELLERRDGVLDLYLNLFHRSIPTLFFMGLLETDGAAYELFSLQAELVARYLAARRENPEHVSWLEERRARERPDMRGGREYLATQRHDYYVKGDVYRRLLEAELGRMDRR